MADESARDPASAHQADVDRVPATTKVMAEIARSSMASLARDNHGTLARLSHLASLTAERLQQAVQSSTVLDQATVDGVLAALREMQNDGHLAYIRQMGSEADYQQIGTKLRRKLQTPGGKWRR